METLLHNLSEVFAVSIIHSMWQCLLVYLVLRVLLADILRFNASIKYNLAVAALIISTFWFIYTLFDQASAYSWQLISTVQATPQHLPLWLLLKHAVAANDRYEVAIAHYLPYITTVYVIGLLFNSLRLLTGWFQIQQLKKYGQTDHGLQQMVSRLSVLLNLKKSIALVCSDKIDVPCITGYLKPLILMPLSLVNYLSVAEVESILLHELAHAKRNDYLINLLQQVISVVLFFNPFIYLMNRLANQERENSCDDMVVSITGKPLVYAQALLKIEQNNTQQWQLALAATGKNNFHLLNRIERIMKTKKPMVNIRHLVLALTILVCSITSIAWLNPSIAAGKLSINKVKPVVTGFFTDTVKAKKATKAAGADVAKKAPVTKKDRTVRFHDGDVWFDNFNDPELQRLSADVQKHGEAISKYYESADFKKLQQDMEKTGSNMEKFYNSDAIKKWQADQEQAGKDFEAKWGDKSETEKLGKQMEAAGKKIESYFNSPDFKKYHAALRKKYNIPQDQNYSDDSKDENYRKYQAELKQHIPAEVTAQTDEIKKMGEQMKSRFNSPEFKAQTQRMRAMGDSLRKAFNDPEGKYQKELMKKLGEQMRAYQNSPEIKHEQEQLKIASQKLREYTKSPAFKKRMEEYKKTMKAANLNFNIDDDAFNVPAPLSPAAVAVPDVPALPAVPATAPTSAPEPAKP